MKFLDAFLKPFVMALRQPVESFIRLETADEAEVLVSEDGSLISFVKIEGSRQIIGQEEYDHIVEDAVVKLGSRFDRPGHALQVYFTRNPERMKDEIQGLLRPNHTAAVNIGLDLDDVFEERQRHLVNYLAWEEIYFVLWTRPSALTKNEMEREVKKARTREWVAATNAQYPLAALDGLRTRHRSFITATLSALEELQIKAHVLEVHDAVRAVRNNLFLTGTTSKWRPLLPGDPIPPRAPESARDLSDILWPPLRQQIAAASARIVSDHVVEMGNHLWGSIDMTLAPMEPSPFPMLLSRLTETGVPFRISFLMEGGGIQGVSFQNFIASVLAVTHAENKQVKESIEALTVISRSEPVVKIRISLATWAPKGNLDLLEDRLSTLTQATESWGYCQVSHIAGDPLAGLMSSALGIACASTAPAAVAPMREIMKLLPWQRASSPFVTGAVLFRTPDGRIWPYQMGSTLTTTWFDLIFAQPGAGKSVLMNALNLGTCLSAGLNALPFVAVIDIGPSSTGLVSLLRDALPAHRRHEASAYRMRMSQEFSVNPFDTKLGMRFPQVDERSYLVELLTLLATPPGQKQPYDGIPQLAGLVVDEMYRWRDDVSSNAEPRPYLPRLDPIVDAAIKAANVELPADPYWWDVVDALFDAGKTYEAGLAQRHAVPVLGDAITASRRPQIKNLLEETQIGASAEGVIHAFERMITSAVREFPILSGVTRFEISETRVCALDLADVCPQGDETAERQTAVMYMLARHILVNPWWINEDGVKAMPPKYQGYHEARLMDIAESPKRLCYDEFHRTSGSRAVRNQLIRDVREGRKRGIQIVLSSQLLDDFDQDMVDLATGVWILGTAISDRAVDEAQKRFGLSDTAHWIIRHRLTGPKASGAPALLVLGTNEGRYEQHLINTLGPIELWALSTSAEDVAVRQRLYTRLGAHNARKLLAANFPGGSARSEIRRRINTLSERGEVDKASTFYVIEQIVSELVDSTKITIEQVDMKPVPADLENRKNEKGEPETPRVEGEPERARAPAAAARPRTAAPAIPATPPALPQKPSGEPPPPDLSKPAAAPPPAGGVAPQDGPLARRRAPLEPPPIPEGDFPDEPFPGEEKAAAPRKLDMLEKPPAADSAPAPTPAKPPGDEESFSGDIFAPKDEDDSKT